MSFDPKSPTHNLCVKRFKTQEPYHQIGVAWANEKGQLRIKLDVGTTLRWTDNITIDLFPRDNK